MLSSLAGFRSYASSLRERVGRARRDYRGYEITELIPADPIFDAGEVAPRVNLVVLAMNTRATFGGASTAVRLLKAVAPGFARARIVVIAESEASFEADLWAGWELESRTPSASRTAAFISPTHKLVVGPGDRFIATHWRTAYFLSSLQKAQIQHANFEPALSGYLIQDFEPAFYPWGSCYVLADSTYRNKRPTIAVFNTNILREYFEQNGYRFVSSFAFEPKLNPSLATFLKNVEMGRKQRLLLVYGRPVSPRNAFGLVLEALTIWARTFPRSSEWQVVSIGFPHKNIELAPNVTMRSKGKATLEEYASHMVQAAVGLSLMISPHPSYPPLEMAEFSVRVVTNNFGNKDLSARSPYITSVSEITPDSIAEALAHQCDQFEQASPIPGSAGAKAFLGGQDEFPFAAELAERLKSG